MMRIAFRVDASSNIGYGHFMRCLTLADSLASECFQIMFLCRQLPLHFQKMIGNKGYDFSLLTNTPVDDRLDDLQYSHWLGVSQHQDAINSFESMKDGIWDFIVIDHYGIDYRWEKALRKKARMILVIDDLADRHHDCDVLIDQNLYNDMNDRYIDLVPSACRLFLGPKFAFLRPEFHEQRKNMKVRCGNVKNILVYFGGVDSDNNTLLAIEALMNVGYEKLMHDELKIVVVIGEQHPALSEIKLICIEQNFACHVQTKKMAELMSQADLAIGAGGISTFERLYLRLPAILKATESNQLLPLTYMSSIGLFELYSSQKALESLLKDALQRKNIPPPDCVEDGNSKLVTYITDSYISLRKTSRFDVRRTFKWLQNKQLREDFLLSKAPEKDNHFKYWRKLIKNSTEQAYSIYYCNIHVGNCGLKNIDSDSSSCELWVYIADLSVRGRGVAKTVVIKLLAKAKADLSIGMVYLHVAKSNLKAVGLYESTGFHEEKGLLKAPWEHREREIQKMECLL
jgi:UDP-2,4-diacetamido-2,4,6-trideoxy-beta-L-altropyranose hydrolase